ncbi:MAG: hypothetical protein INR71_14860, partial [Terriglobus roseus]|nr:hypothetical protein [Terriglobus roseus]
DDALFHEVFSNSTRSRRYFDIKFGSLPALNPNIVPHPVKEDTWIMVAQEEKVQSQRGDSKLFVELVCNAVFVKDKLVCTDPPADLPVSESEGGKCGGNVAYFNFARGPHDARVFYGPDAPYIIYGSNSRFTCFGEFIQDMRMLVDEWSEHPEDVKLFRKGTEIQRPPPYGRIEKNWFVFWDMDNQIYAHYDTFPNRTFSRIEPDGSVGPDLALPIEQRDRTCMAKHMPKLTPQLESIHQATNSLSISLCRRSDPDCTPSEENTFILTLFHHKRFHYWHGVYEPLAMLFKRAAPFDMVAIQQKPLWVSGRGPFTWRSTAHWRSRPVPKGQSEMFYVTSITWKASGQMYHGYLDDVLFIGFGIEDSRAAAIDVTAEDVLKNMAFCDEYLNKFSL